VIRVILCEDQTLMRQGLRTILDLEPGLDVVAEAANGREAVDRALATQPDVALIDVQMPLMNGIEATRELTRLLPTCRVIILTTFDYEDYVLEGLRAGAAGYLLKDTPADDLTRTIRRIHAGESFVQPEVAARMLAELSRRTSPVEQDALSQREREILRLLAAGDSNRVIGERLALAEGTVKNYVSGILAKLHASNRTQAVSTAREKRLI
jgi:two-component system, NarL family, response regulator DegU